MGLITYQNIENNTPATANTLNERFGQIVNTINGEIDSANIKDGAITLAKISSEIYQKMYPIGSVYINASDNTSPSTLLGFGTWEAFGQGRVPVGKADTGTFASAGATMGTESETLTLAQVPSHSHSGTTNNAGNHSHSTTAQVAIKTSSTVGLRTQYNDAFSWGAVGTTTNGDHNHTFGTNAQGGDGSHNNIQPSVVVYMWKRVG